MTQALVRKCPDPECARIIIKSDGCNKITCPCGAVFCNVCRTRITNGYDHFCRTFDCRHEKCGMCGLWTSTMEADERAISEAKKKGEEDNRSLNDLTVPHPYKGSVDVPKVERRRRRLRIAIRLNRRRRQRERGVQV